MVHKKLNFVLFRTSVPINISRYMLNRKTVFQFFVFFLRVLKFWCYLCCVIKKIPRTFWYWLSIWTTFGSYLGISCRTVLHLLIHWSMSNVIYDTKPTKFTTCSLDIFYYNITLNIATCFGSQGTICGNFQIKYIGFFQDTVYQDPAQLCTTVQKMSTF
jgi:hypothetical protein